MIGILEANFLHILVLINLINNNGFDKNQFKLIKTIFVKSFFIDVCHCNSFIFIHIFKTFFFNCYLCGWTDDMMYLCANTYLLRFIYLDDVGRLADHSAVGSVAVN
jgi:hypothetical protein